MTTIDLQSARKSLSRLVDEAAAGEEIIIARAGRPVARLVPVEPPEARPRRRLGILAGQASIPDDFDAPLAPAVVDRFESG